MAIRLSLFTDNFTRANENPLSDGGKWSTLVESVSNPMQVVSNAAEATVANARNTSYLSGVSLPANQWASLTIGAPLFSVAGVYLRVTSGASFVYYRFVIDIATGQWLIQGVITPAGVLTTLAIVSGAAITTGDVMLFTAIGSTLTGYKNGIEIVAVTDSTLPSGAAGFGDNPATSVTNGTFTRFSAGQFINGAGLLLGVGAIFL